MHPTQFLLDVLRVFISCFQLQFFWLCQIISALSFIFSTHTVYTHNVLYVDTNPILSPVQSCMPYRTVSGWGWGRAGYWQPSTVSNSGIENQPSLFWGIPKNFSPAISFPESPRMINNSLKFYVKFMYVHICNFSRRQVHNFHQTFKGLKIQEKLRPRKVYIQVNIKVHFNSRPNYCLATR